VVPVLLQNDDVICIILTVFQAHTSFHFTILSPVSKLFSASYNYRLTGLSFSLDLICPLTLTTRIETCRAFSMQLFNETATLNLP
jgi:hypothetical protein